jgi:hypothetical protein
MSNKISKKSTPSGIPHKKDVNEGSSGFNQGSAQDPDYDKGTKVSDEEKRTGHTPSPGKAKEKGKKNMGKNLTGGY